MPSPIVTCLRTTLATGIVVVAVGLPVAVRGESDDPCAAEVLARVQQARAAAGLPALERRPALDRAAQARAEQVAALPHAERLTVDEPIGDRLREAGVPAWRKVMLHLDMQRGFSDPAAAFHRNWTRHRTWSRLTAEEFDAIGIGTARGEDGWLVLVAVLLRDELVPQDLAALERATVIAINAERERYGLAPLDPLESLSDVARRHSADMAQRDFFSHRSPDGRETEDRVRSAGYGFRALAENIFRGARMDDPVGEAVSSWMTSPGHRRNVLGEPFTHTGVGIAVDGRGALYFTQLFLTPR